MTSQQMKTICEKLGFGIAHARRNKRTGEVRAYVSTLSANNSDVNELRWLPDNPGEFLGYEHATKPNGYTQYDKLVARFTIADLAD